MNDILHRLLDVLHPGAIGLIANHHGIDRGEEAGALVVDAKAFLAMPETPMPFNKMVQVVVFASEGVTRSVAVRPLPEGGVPCIVVDYDDRHGRDCELTCENFERECLGCTRDEFDNAGAVYLW